MEKIKVIGFDLDQTLYPKSPEVDTAIQQYIIERIAEMHGVKVDEADTMFRKLYQNGAGLSGRKTLIELGFSEEDAYNIVQEALERAKIEDAIFPDQKINKILESLKKNFILDIITGSAKDNAERKLAKLEIPTTLFNHIITADNGSKSDLTAFKLWLSLYPEFNASEFLYIGDRPSSDYEAPKQLGISSILVNVKQDDQYDCPQLANFSELLSAFS